MNCCAVKIKMPNYISEQNRDETSPPLQLASSQLQNANNHNTNLYSFLIVFECGPAKMAAVVIAEFVLKYSNDGRHITWRTTASRTAWTGRLSLGWVTALSI